MTASTIDQDANQFAESSAFFTLTVFRLIEGLLRLVPSQMKEDKYLLSVQIAAILTSLTDIHFFHCRMGQKLAWLDVKALQPCASSHVCQAIDELLRKIEDSDLSSKTECLARLMDLGKYYSPYELSSLEDNASELPLQSIESNELMPKQYPAKQYPAEPSTRPYAPPFLVAQEDKKKGYRRRR